MKKIIYIVLFLFIVMGCSAKREIVKENEKRDVVETIDLSSIEQSTLLIHHLLDNSNISIEFTPLSDSASYTSDSTGTTAKGMKVKVNINKNVTSTNTQKDNTNTETRTEHKNDKKKNKKTKKKRNKKKKKERKKEKKKK